MWFLSFFFFVSLSFSHDLQHKISTEGKCVIVHFYFPDNTKFSYESFEIYKNNSKTPFQVGRTDALGRVVFCPDESGEWIVKAFSEDGHGKMVKVYVDNATATSTPSLFDRYKKLFVGAGFILGIFGLTEIYLRRFIKWLGKRSR